jgi:hypothetical protein
LGSRNQVTYELAIESDADGLLVERLQPIVELISHAVELHEARQERGELTSLWPTEGVLPESGPVFYG